MNKAVLKESWGAYCDTDKLVDRMMELLTKYGHRNSEHGVCTMLNEYFTNKKSLIDLFSKSENYAGDMRIIFDIELARENNARDVAQFCDQFGTKIGAKRTLLKYQDADGKKVTDYLKVGIKKINVDDLDDAEIVGKLDKAAANVSAFNDDGTTKESYSRYCDFVNTVCSNGMRYISAPTLTQEHVDVLHSRVNYKLAPGMKTSRAFNRICTYYKLNEKAEYNKLFAQYADMVSSNIRKLKFFISVNPLDYLTMSFGNSWASCHTIDKNNRRNMPNAYSGMYCGGTLSYMLDKTSIITYVHSNIPEDVEEGKLYRNMFHYGDGLLIQSRIYPQGSDGNTDLYKVFRGFVQKEFADILGLEKNLWTKKSGYVRNSVRSRGMHYHDYTSFNNCNITYPSEYRDRVGCSMVQIGHEGICPYCGEEFSYSSTLSHDSCDIPTNWITSTITYTY